MRQVRVFEAERASVTAARRFAREVLAGLNSEMLDTVELMVSELTTNCVRHVQANFEVAIRRSDDEIGVEVSDSAGGQPVMRAPGPDEVAGRGLRIVDLLAARWGVRYDASGGKTVWFTLGLPPAGSSGSEPATHAQRPQRPAPARAGAEACTAAGRQDERLRSLSVASRASSKWSWILAPASRSWVRIRSATWTVSLSPARSATRRRSS
jgi:anti-sigma regulatory factor (Ser/Thr protein kinase)